VSASATIVRPVTPEFRGQARAWLSRLDAEDAGFGPMATRVGQALRAPLARGKIATPEDLQETARQWRDELPTAGRLKLEIDISQRSLTIRELRASTAEQFIPERWTSKEDALAIHVLYISAKRRASFEYKRQLIATVSLHALSRRMQRAFDCSDEAIRDDLIILAGASEENYHADGRFSVRVPGGVWAGTLRIFPDDGYVWCCRTFLSDAEIA
jgi:hypothetical protein